MVKKFLKKQSKRIPAKRRYKIEKKVREHNKKMKKQAKKNPKKSRPKKDPGVPNSLPFKKEILKEAEERKKRAEELKQKQKEERHSLLMEKRGLSNLKENAEKRSKAFDKTARDESGSDFQSKSKDSSVKAYYKEFRKVVEAADVILEVLDARDPLGSRCPQVEETVISSGTKKKLVLIVNKIDLIPKINLIKWLKYLRNELPTVAFKSSTQTQKAHLSRSKLQLRNDGEELSKTSHCLGADILMKLLGNYCRNEDVRNHIRVGVVGFPNVGKSSIINSLKRNRVCTVGATPGVTKAMQEIHLDKHIVLLDSPGIVMAKENDVRSAMKNAIKIETLEDPVAPVEEILKRCNKNQMMARYRIGEYNSNAEFLALVAKKQGKLKKRGIPNIEMAARTVLTNWNEGKIKYFTHPPAKQELPSYLDARIVSEMSEPFDLALMISEEEKETIEPLGNVLEDDFIATESAGLTQARNYKELQISEVSDLEVNDASNSVKESVTLKEVDDVPKRMKEKTKKLESALNLDGNLKLNKMSKTQFKNMKKRMKKQTKRTEKIVSSISDTLAESLKLGSPNEDYDFEVDFQQ